MICSILPDIVIKPLSKAREKRKFYSKQLSRLQEKSIVVYNDQNKKLYHAHSLSSFKTQRRKGLKVAQINNGLLFSVSLPFCERML